MHNYDVSITRGANGSLELIHAGRKDVFANQLGRPPSDSELPLMLMGPAGLYETITENKDHTFTRTFAHGTRQEFNELGLLTSIHDTNGNTITLKYNLFNSLISITDSLGRQIIIEYYPKDVSQTGPYRIKSIMDWTGRKWLYVYDIDFNLVDVTAPATAEYPNGLTSSQGYSQYGMTSMTDSKGQLYLKNRYNPADGKLIEQDYGDGTFLFDFTSAGPDKTLSTDRNGNVTEHGFNSIGNPLYQKTFTKGIYPGEPEFYLAQTEFNVDSEVTNAILPAGNSAALQYSIVPIGRGNVTEVRQKSADPAEPDIVSSATYDMMFNKIKTDTDSRGYTTTVYYDWEESTLGDLNGDGITTQKAGNPIKIVYPETTLPDGTKYTPVEYFWYNEYGQTIRYIDPEGYVTVWTYYPEGDPAHGYKKSVTVDYSVDPTEIDQKAGKTSIGQALNKAGKPHLNLTYNYLYDSVGNVTGVTDAKGRLSNFEVNALNQVTKVKSRLLTSPANVPYSIESSMAYDENGNVTSTRITNYDENGILYSDMPYLTYEFTYDILDNMTSTKAQVGPNKFITSYFEYDLNENIVKTIEPEGNFHTTKYDERNLPYQQIQGADNPAEQQVTNYAYNENAGLAKVTYGDGITTKGAVTNFYDNYDRLQKTMDEIGNYTEYVRDIYGFVRETKRVDDTGNVLSHNLADYDELGRANILTENYFVGTGQGPVLPAVTQVFFDKSGRTDKVLDAKNRASYYKWDGIGRLIASIDELGNKAEAEYDANSNPVKLTETEVDTETMTQETFVSQNVFDPLDRLIRTIDNAQNVSEVKYDGRSNVVWAKDREGNTVLRKYDGLSRLTDTIYQMRQGGTGAGLIEKEITLHNEFDDNSRLISRTDGKGNVSSTAYDAVGRVKTETLPDGTQKGYFYRPEGVLHHSIDANGTDVIFGYDNALRLIHKDIQKGAGVEGTTFEDYWYDGANRLTLAQNDNSIVTRKYNSYGQAYEETSAVMIDGQTQTKTIQSEFDILGNRTGLTYPSGKQISFDRDALDRVKYIVSAEASAQADIIAEYQYKGYRVKTRKSGNGTQLDIAYDAMRRITQYQDNFVGTGQGPVLGVANFEYGYNNEGMRTYENYIPGNTETNQQSRGKVFTYDSLYQITGVKYDVPDSSAEIAQPGSQTFSKQVTYQFDNSGNRNAVETQNFASLPTIQNYQSNSLNQYTTIDSSIFGYDNAGNMTTGIIYLDDSTNPGQKTPVLADFVYDYANKLVKVKRQNDNSILGEYLYDVLGRRVYKNAYDLESVTYQATLFWYNGVECVEETDNTEQTIASYVFGIGIDKAIRVEYTQTSEQYPQSGTYWYHTDVLGSAVAITDSAGTVIECYKYDIYGEATVLEPDGQTVRAESVIGNRILYTGREYDAETGLYYYRARYYHAQIGRFISADPIGSDGLGNLFGYVGNNPANWYDPYGLTAKQPVASWFAGDPRLAQRVPYEPVENSQVWNEFWNTLAGFEREVGVQNPSVQARYKYLGQGYDPFWLNAALQQLKDVMEYASTLEKSQKQKTEGNEFPQITINPGAGGVGVLIGVKLPNGGFLTINPPHGSTSVIIILEDKANWYSKQLRLDYGYNKNTGKIDWHWNQDGTFTKYGIRNHTPAAPTEAKVGRVLKYAPAIAKVAIVTGVIMDLYSIYSADDIVKETFARAAGWAGAIVGAETLGAMGASIGSHFGHWGIIIGGGVGSFIGGTLGYVGYYSAAEYICE